jgi:hypothetical protein
MKKLISLIIALGSLSFLASANTETSKFEGGRTKQSSGEGKCFDENSHIINLGVGIGHAAYYRGISGIHYSSSPVFSLSYEQPWKKRIGPGYLGVGAYAGFQTELYRYDYSYTYRYGNYYYAHRWNYITTAARAAYHWDVLNKGKLEAYGGTIIGLRFQLYHYTSNDPYTNYQEHKNAVYPAFAVFAGGRYYFAKNFAVYSELSFGIAYLNAGLSYKF